METFGRLLKRYLRSEGLERVARLEELHRLWRTAAPPEWRGETRVLGCRGGELEIGVRSSALLYELKAFRREELLRRLRAAGGPPVHGLRLRLLRTGDEE